MERRLLTLLAETPVHAGGAESLAAVDLPIQREAATGLPVIWGQSLKGALRDAVHTQEWAEETAIFGSPPPTPSSGAGGSLLKGDVAVGDAQLLLLPAAAMRRVFAWATSVQLLNRLDRKLALLGAGPTDLLGSVRVRDRALGSTGWQGTQVLGPVLEDVVGSVVPPKIGAFLAGLACPATSTFGWTRDKLADDLLILPDDTLATLASRGTDVVARVQLGDDKTVANGPFYSEHLPSETVLAAVLTGGHDHLERLKGLLDGKVLQLGGDETVGKGVLWCRVHDAASVAELLPAAAAATVADTPATSVAVAPGQPPRASAPVVASLSSPRPSVPSAVTPSLPRPGPPRSGSPASFPSRRPR